MEPERGEAGPRALVLSGGGARAAYQVGVLSGIVERAGDVAFPIVTGVSAGAINAAFLAAHRAPLAETVARLRQIWLGMSVEQVFRPGVLSLAASALRWAWMMLSGPVTPRFQVRGVLDTRPLRKMLTELMDARGIEANLASGRLGALGLSATDYASGQTVTFVDGAGELPVWRRAGRVAVRARIGVEHVLASSALPLVFPAVAIEGRWYGDGSVRQTTPLAPSIHLGARRILAISVRHGRVDAGVPDGGGPAPYPPAAQVLGMLFNAVFLDALDADAERLERINRTVALEPPGRDHPEGLRHIELHMVRPSRDLGRLSADLLHCLPGSLRAIARGLGTQGLKTPDLLSYLLFERPYVERLLELGRADALAGWDALAPLLEPAPAR